MSRTVERRGETFRRVVIQSPSGMRIGLTRHDASQREDDFSPVRVGLDHLSFGCADRHEMEAWEQRLRASDVATEGIVDAGDRLVLSFRDPDGIALEFFAVNAG